MSNTALSHIECLSPHPHSSQRCFWSKNAFHSKESTTVGSCLWNQPVFSSNLPPRTIQRTRKGKELREDSVRVPVGREHPGKVGFYFEERCICSGSETTTWGSLSSEPEQTGPEIRRCKEEQLPLLLPLVTPCISVLQLPYKQSQTGRLAQQKLEVGSSKIKVAAKLGFPDYG